MRGFFVYAGAFASGVAFQFLDPAQWEYTGAIVILGVALSFGLSKKTLGVMLICLGLGMLRTWHAQQFVGDPGLVMPFEGVIVEDPEFGPRDQKIVVDAGKERVRISVPSYPVFAYGDRVRIDGKLERPEPFETDSGRMFDHASFLARDGIYHIINRGEATLIERRQGNNIQFFFIRAKHAFVESIQKTVSEPYAGLANGVVLGVEGALSEADEESFRFAGLIHIIVVSGYNITMAGNMAAAALRAFPPVVGSLGSLGGIVAYIMLTGASSTAVRAGIMASLVVLSKITKRHYDVTRALVLAGVLMVLHTPYVLLYDPSFQLSFLATWGLTNITPFFQRHLARVPEALGLREAIATTLGAQTAVTPLLLYMSGSTNVLSLIANIVVVPIMAFYMIAALGVGIAGFASPYLALPFSIAIELMSSWVFFVVHLMQKTDVGVFGVGLMPVWVLAVIYSCLLFAVRYAEKQNTLRSESILPANTE